jgi:hypothetical protein
VQFDGIDDAVEIPTTGWNVNSGTITLWANAADLSGVRYLFGHNVGTSSWSNRIQLYTDEGNLALGLGDSHVAITGIRTLTPETWYHIALTWDGTNYAVYTNGIEDVNGSYTGLTTLNTIADIGNTGNTSSRNEAFNGIIDEVRVYNRALSANEVQALFNDAPSIANKIEIFEIWDYNEPANPNDLRHFFFTAIETDSTVNLVEVNTPAGDTFTIPNDVNTQLGDIQTRHSVDNNTHLWEYEAEFNDVAELDNYGDGTYTITVHYLDDSNGQTTVWFGIPGDSNAIPQPIQEPNLIFPPHNGSVTSPVTFQWEPCTDVNATSIHLWLENQDANDKVGNAFSPTDTNSDPIVLSEGIWEAQLCFDHLYDYNNADGTPVEIGKYSESDYTFSVINAAPVISSVTATPSTILDNETSQLQVVATNPDSGPFPLSCNWIVQPGEGSLNTTTIANPIYTPPDVNSTQTFTLTVEDSDSNDTTISTVDITVIDAMVSVPNVVGLSQSSAELAISSSDLVVGTVSNAYSDSVAAGLIISQNPTGGSSAVIGSAVDLVVSLGQPTVPDVVGLAQAAAESAITAAGLTVGTVTSAYSDTVAAGSVISSTPVGATTVAVGSAVDIEISQSKALELEPIGDKSVDENKTLSFTINATGADGDTITYSAQNLPAKAKFSGNTFTWKKPWYGSAGDYHVTFIARAGHQEDSETITITVNPVKQAGWYERWLKHLKLL